MTIWRVVEVLAIGAVVLIGGAVAGIGAAWLLARVARRFGTDDIVIPKPVEKFPKLTADEVEALRARADARRERADERRAEGHQIDSGQPVNDRIIKLIGGRR